MNDAPILVHVPDLMMRQQLVQGLRALGYPADGSANDRRLHAALESGPPRAILVELDGVDVDAPTLVGSLTGDPRLAGTPVVGFCAHTRTELMDAARDAGAARVVSRGELTRRLGPVVAELVGPPAPPRA